MERGKETLPLDGRDFQAIVRSLLQITATFDTTHQGYTTEDLEFFASSSEALLNKFWQERNPGKDRLIRERCRSLFVGVDREVLVAKICYLRSFLEEIGPRLGEGTSSSHTTQAPPANRFLQLGFGLGDLVYQRDPEKRLRIDDTLAFPKLETDIFSSRQKATYSNGQAPSFNGVEQTYSSDVYEFVSALNTLKKGDGWKEKALDDEEKLFPCAKCNMTFKRNSDLRRHVQIHMTKLPHVCHNCGKSFARKDALKRHSGTQTCKRNRENGTYLGNLT